MGAIRERLRKTRPDVEEQLLLNKDKRALARVASRARKQQGLTIDALAAASGLSDDEVLAIEAPTGELPSLKSLFAYAEACGLRLNISFVPATE
ncbi:hypothetical protein ROJ8625_03756 [Roseivivax jejudonensis]|uniref:HTH cro/C1-type domain-containing protein n=2 Tax=Roseivivax jejudonensis TaxID=1529041 RepID=A0A1X7A6R8_9RHOB|nr:hypothetical protein ROJ8625_03756 [Roseivivax jejudonensis]